jgi:acyl-CoA thioesterase-1
MIDSKVLLPEPDAPTMATDSCARNSKLMSWRMVKVPVESATCLVMCWTAMIGWDMRLLGSGLTRRALLRHCSLLALAGIGARESSAQAGSRRGPLLVVGDSLSAEYGLERGSGWVALLQQRLAREKVAIEVVNASISGDTTSGGRTRLPALLAQHKPSVVIIELGGNDALRGLPLNMTQANLGAMAQAARAAGARVLLVGMQLPPNYGQKYAQDFAALFSGVAQAEGTALLPFFLKGVADGPDADRLFQADRIHPNAEAQARMLGNVWPVLKPLLK